MNEAIKSAISIVGTQKKLAKACGVSQSAVQKWLYNKSKVSPEKVSFIVKATGGAVKGYEVRPDMPEFFPRPEDLGQNISPAI